MIYNEKRFQTEKKIKKTFLALYKKEDVMKISVSRLCREADIDRSAFYIHNSCIKDLIKKIEDDTINIGLNFMNQIIADWDEKSLDKIFQQIFRFIQTNENDYIIMIRKGGSKFRQKFINSITKAIKSEKKNITNEDEDFIAYCLTYHLAACSEIMNMYDVDSSDEESNAMLRQLLEISNTGVLTVLHEHCYRE